MATTNQLDKLSKIVGGFEQSNWLEKAKERKANSEEILARQKIALRILRALRQSNTSQKQLAAMLNVSPQQVNKWVKGSENFSLDTIIKIQQALNIVIIEIVQPKQELHSTKLFKHSGNYVQVKTVSLARYVAQSKEQKLTRSEKYSQQRKLAYA